MILINLKIIYNGKEWNIEKIKSKNEEIRRTREEKMRVKNMGKGENKDKAAK